MLRIKVSCIKFLVLLSAIWVQRLLPAERTMFACKSAAHASIVNHRNHNGSTNLHLAAHTGKASLVKRYLRMLANRQEAGRYVAATNHFGVTALHCAAQSKSPQTLQALCDALPQEVVLRHISSEKKTGGHSLHLAAGAGDPDSTRLLLNILSKHDSACVRPLLTRANQAQGYTPLHVAVSSKSKETCEVLVEHLGEVVVENVLLQGNDGNTPLHLACAAGAAEVALYLQSLCNKQQLMQAIDVRNSDGLSFIDAALMKGLHEVVSEVTKKVGQQPMAQLFASEGKEIKSGNNFMLALYTDNTEALSRFCTSGNFYNLLSGLDQFEVPVCHGAFHRCDERIVEYILARLSATDRVKILLLEDDKGFSTLDMAVSRGDGAILRLALAELDQACFETAVRRQRTSDGATMLHTAVGLSRNMCFELLLERAQEHGRAALLEDVSRDGLTLLHYAAMSNNVIACRRILDEMPHERKVNFVKAQTSKGKTALHVAAENGSKDVVDLLLKVEGAYPDCLSLAQYDDIGKTPLHSAVLGLNAEVVRTLLEQVAPAQRAKFLSLQRADVGYDFGCGTVFHVLAQHEGTQERAVEVAKEMLSHIDAEKFAQVFARQAGMHKLTAGTIAIRNGNIEILQAYLAHLGERPIARVKDKHGANLLHDALLYNKDDVVALLLAHCTEVDRFNLVTSPIKGTGLSALHIAAFQGKIETVRSLLTGLTPEHAETAARLGNADGSTVLHIAALQGNRDLVLALCGCITGERLFSVMTQCDNFGVSAFHLAAAHGFADSMEAFLEVCAPDLRGQLRLHVVQAAATSAPGPSVESCFEEMQSNAQKDDVYSIGLWKKLLQRPDLSLFVEDQNEYHKALADWLGMFPLALRRTSMQGLSVLHCAAICGNVAVIPFLMKSLDQQKKEQLMLQTSANGRTALHIAAFFGHDAFMRVLLENVSSEKAVEYLSKQDSHNMTPLGYSLSQGAHLCTQFLFERQADQSPHVFLCRSNVHGLTGFDLLAKSGNETIFKQFLERMTAEERTQVARQKNSHGRNSVHALAYYASSNMSDTYSEHLDKQTEVELLQQTDTDNRSLLHTAACQGKAWIVDFMIKQLDRTTLRRLLDVRDIAGLTALETAVVHRQREVVNALLRCYEQHEIAPLVRRKGPKKRDLIHLAVRAGDTELVESLVEQADQDEIYTGLAQIDQRDNAVLHLACKSRRADMVEWVYANIDEHTLKNFLMQRNKSGLTALNIAVRLLDEALISSLLSHMTPAEVYQLVLDEDDTGCNILHSLAHAEAPGCLKLLLQKLRSDIETSSMVVSNLLPAKNKRGETVCHIVAQRGSVDAVKVVFSAFSDPDETALKKMICDKNNEGETTIHCAAKYGRLVYVEAALMAIGVDAQRALIQEKDQKGCNGLHQLLADDYTVEAIKLFIKNLDEQDLVGLLRDINAEDDTVLHVLARQPRKCAIFKALLERLSAASVRTCISVENTRGTSVEEVLKSHGAKEMQAYLEQVLS